MNNIYADGTRCQSAFFYTKGGIKIKREAVRETVLTGLLAAVTAVCAQITIMTPSGVPVTLQTFAVALCGFTLGRKRGITAVAVYITLGLVGVPVFAGFRGGISAVLSPTGGFLWGFLPLAFFCGMSRDCTKAPTKWAVIITGLLLCHLCGALQFSAAVGGNVISAVTAVSFPFLPKDIISVICAAAMSDMLKKRLKSALKG